MRAMAGIAVGGSERGETGHRYTSEQWYEAKARGRGGRLTMTKTLAVMSAQCMMMMMMCVRW